MTGPNSTECNLAIKEENELLREQDLLRVEVIERMERKQEQLETEVSQLLLKLQLAFFKEQNSELIKRMDDFEMSCITDAENASVMFNTDG